MPLPEQQENYKYGICIDGHSAADRMGFLFNGRQAILKVDSPIFSLAGKAWISDFIFAWEHYVPVKKNLTDLQIGINWLQKNDENAVKMANRCKKMHETYFCKPTILEWWKTVSSL